MVSDFEFGNRAWAYPPKGKWPEGTGTIGLIYSERNGPSELWSDRQKKYCYLLLEVTDIFTIVEKIEAGYEFHAFHDKEGYRL